MSFMEIGSRGPWGGLFITLPVAYGDEAALR